MSSWIMASRAAASMVIAAIAPTKPRAAAFAWTNTLNIRPITYTPAATIVAAWISAETGVGPAIASGSHTYRGNWADFPIAPPNSSSVLIIGVAAAKLYVLSMQEAPD